jgi:N-methylhydantoinase B
MFKPIFFENRLQGFAVVIAHHCDVGGRVPGSNAADSTEIFQEGLRIPPTKLYAAGEQNETLVDIIRKNVRLPDLVLGDLDAQLATCNIGERELLRMIDRYGEDNLRLYFDELLDYGERLTRKAIEAWPDGTYEFTDYIDNDGFTSDAIPIRCAITVKGSSVSVDFAGSSPQVRGAINSTLSFVKSATYLSIRCVLDADVPNNAGVYRCIDITAPEGSILNPRLPAPVAARALTGYRVVDTVFGALAQIAPKKVMAAGEGGNTVIALSGYDTDASEPFILVDMINGAWGGRSNKDGVEGVTNPSQNMSNMPIETLESRYPILMEEYGFRNDSGGAGRYRGGLGLVRQYRILAKRVVAQVRSDRADHAPYGLFGGAAGAPSRNILNPETTAEAAPSKFTMELAGGAVIRHEQAGGGGYGDPFERALELIERDLLDGKVTSTFAEQYHGVVLDQAGKVDRKASEHKRLARG